MGIIAAIIAFVKGHDTYGWCMVIWVVLAVILSLCGFKYAGGPGIIFLQISVLLSNERKAEKERQEELKRLEEAHRQEMAERRKTL